MKTTFFSAFARQSLAVTLAGGMLVAGPASQAASVIFQRGYVDEQYGFGGSLYQLDPDSTADAFFFGGGNHPNYSPDGAQITFIDVDGDLAQTPAADYSPTNLVIAGGGSVLSGLKPKWSPDATLIAYQTNGNKIAIVNATCTSGNEYNPALCNYTKLDETSGNVNTDPAWYPIFSSNSGSRGGRIIFVRAADGNGGTPSDIFATDLLIDANGVPHETGTVNLTQSPGSYEAPSYSHDGSKIIFVQQEALWLMNADGTNQHPIVSSADNGLVYGFDPAFSSDDKKITWGSGSIYTADLVINANGSVSANNIAQITNSSSDRSPSWTGESGSGGGGGDATNNSFTVPGTANIWLAGAAAGTTASNGQDTLANAKPYQVQGLTLHASDLLTFSASGSVSNDPALPNGTGPDGGPYLGIRFYLHALENHIAALTAPINSLVGVFLDDSVPAGTAPAALNFNGGVTGGTSYGSISPKLQQPFFIGDGLDDNGRLQSVVVPGGATRLFLGSMDPSQNSNNLGSFAVIVNPPAPPDHGGLSATTFLVNGSTGVDASVTPDGVLRFKAYQTGFPAGVSVRVQSSTTPAVESSWKDLNDGLGGEMSFAGQVNAYILNSTSYPQVNGVSFRAVASSAAYPDAVSNVVGPFNLSSMTTHLAAPTFNFFRNGTLGDLYFTATETSKPSGLVMKVQTSTTPTDENSWADLQDPTGGKLLPRSVPNEYYLLAKQIPAATGVYFRVFASTPGVAGFVPGLSAVQGSYTITKDSPPVVAINPITGIAGSGNGKTADHPIILKTGTFSFGASATSPSGQQITSLALLIDGSTVQRFDGDKGTINFTENTIGDHVLQAYAVDKLGATARFGTAPVYIRVIPAATTTKETARDGKTGETSKTAAASAGQVFTAVVSNTQHLWNDPAGWTDAQGNHGVPGPLDLAIVGDTTEVLVSQSVEVKSVTLYGVVRNFVATGEEVDFTVNGMFNISNGTFYGLHVIIPAGGRCAVSVGAIHVGGFSGSIDNYGTFDLQGAASVTGLSAFKNHGVSNFQLPLSLPANPGLDPASDLRAISANVIINTGLITGPNPDGLASQQVLGLVPAASLISQDGGGVVSNDGGSLIAAGAGNLISQDGGGLISQDGGGLISQDGGGVVSKDGGGLISQDGGGLHGNAFVGHNGSAEKGAGFIVRGKGETTTAADATDPASGFTQTAGTTDLNAVSVLAPMNLQGGVLSGSGVVIGDVTNTGGYIAPGHSAGAIALLGKFTQGAKGTLIVEDGGPFPFQYDQLVVTGAATLAGTLDVRTINGYVPDPADTFNPITYASRSGEFDTVSSNAAVAVDADGVLVSDDPSLPQPPAGQLLNISTRMDVGTGDKVMIAGFIITGSSSKKVLIRGLGPELADQGVPGALSDPTLELHKPDGSVVSNDNWMDTQKAAIQATTIPPTKPTESAIIATLEPGAYTAILAGKNSSTGVGLIEVYDLDQGGASAVANISTRGQVETGDNVLIGGLIVGGTEPGTILVRAIGPSLTSLGVAGALADPVLELHDTEGNSITNDNWRENQEAEILASGVAPTTNNESAILATLVPGNYTAVVRGAGDTAGVALVEAFNLQ